MIRNPSDSAEQRRMGTKLVSAFSSYSKVLLQQEKTLACGGSCTVEVDGYSANPPILCEAWAHYGKIKGSNPYKVMTDALKLIFAEKYLGKKYRKILLFSNEDARKPFVGTSWKAQFLRDYGIETKVFPLSRRQSKEVTEAQKRQDRWQH